MQIDPIIAVKDVPKASQWYQQVFGYTSQHGGNDFDVLLSEEGEIMLCLHRWGEHDHPSMKDPGITPGNGLILYFRTNKLETIRQNLKNLDYPVAREIQLNPNSGMQEFSVVDPNGYYLTVSEFHRFGG